MNTLQIISHDSHNPVATWVCRDNRDGAKRTFGSFRELEVWAKAHALEIAY